MKNTLQTLRDLPAYPSVFVKAVTYWIVFYGIASLLIGLPVLMRTFGTTLPLSIAGIVVPLGTFFSNLHGYDAITYANLYSNAGNGIAQTGIQLFSGIIVFWGIAHFWTAWRLASGARVTTAFMQGIWVIYGGLVIAFFSAASHRFGLRPKIEASSLIFFYIIPLTLGAILMFDERIKAYFGEGSFAESYRAYVNMKWEGQTEALPNPWVTTKKE